MVATYNPALTSTRDRMRDALGDIDTTAPMAPDVTYDAYLTDAGDDWRMAAAGLARRFAAQAAGKAQSIQGEPGAINWGDRATKWLKIAAHLEAEAARLRTPSGSWSADAERTDLLDISGEYSVALRRA